MTTAFYVYQHRKATTGEVFYVGKGKCGRAWQRSGRSELWRRTVAKHGYTVEIVMDDMQEWWAFELERDLIALHGRQRLVNHTDGGEGASGISPSQQTRDLISARGRGRKHTDESKRLMSERLKGKKRTPEQVEANRQARIGKPIPQATRDKLSKALMGHSVAEDVRRRIGEGNRGKPRTQEQRDHHSRVMSGRKASLETRQKLSAVRKGKKRSPETLRKIAETLARKKAAANAPLATETPHFD